MVSSLLMTLKPLWDTILTILYLLTYYLSAPCGASTAAPSLCRSALWCVRLLQLLAFCKTVNGCYTSSFSEGFWQFLIVCCGCSPCSDLQKYVMKQRKKSSTICPKPMKDVAKIHERCHGAVASQLLGASGGLCGASRLQNGWWTAAPLRKGCRFFKKSDFGRHFWHQSI